MTTVDYHEMTKFQLSDENFDRRKILADEKFSIENVCRQRFSQTKFWPAKFFVEVFIFHDFSFFA